MSPKSNPDLGTTILSDPVGRLQNNDYYKASFSYLVWTISDEIKMTSSINAKVGLKDMNWGDYIQLPTK